MNSLKTVNKTDLYLELKKNFGFNSFKGRQEEIILNLLKEKDLKGSVIKKFLVLPKELDADDDELTRTRKVRRNFINEKYEVLINALYSSVDNCDFETKVTFEDGRTGSLKANVKILDC